MKITVRLAIYSALLSVIAVIICCAIMLITTANTQINNVIQSGVTELRMFHNAFNAEMDVVGDEQLSKTAKRSLILFVFRKYTDASVSGSQFVLTDTEQTLFNNSPIDPRPLLPQLKDHNGANTGQDDDSSLWPSTIIAFEDQKFLVVGYRAVGLGNRLIFDHEIFLVRDISDVYRGITTLGIRFALIALLTVIVCVIVMICVIKRVMRPLGELQKSASALAIGQYSNRILVQGKDEIAQLGESFNRMADAISSQIKALENTAEQRKMLLSTLTHELKTPMTAIIGYSEALMRLHLSRTQQEESIAYINTECKRIEQLSQKMIHLIALHGGEPVDIQPQPIDSLFGSVRMTLQSIARKENITLSLIENGSPMFEMDIDMMASVLINLFDNARKAGAKHITIKAEGNSISVIDDGAGIPTDEIDKITQPFYTVDQSYTRTAGGSGLGLALCELILNAHRANMHIESQINVGTAVIISFDYLHFDNILKNT